MPVTLKLDFDELRRTADLGVRRATIFMGIGANAARIVPPVSHVLDDRTTFSAIPHDVSDTQKRHFVDEFETWVVANGFRELVETFDVFLCDAYGVIMLMGDRDETWGSWQKEKEAFPFRGGISDHMATVCEILKIENRFSAMFESVKQARNCMAHRRGVVGGKDAPDNGVPFRLTWRTRAAFLAVDGTDVSLALQAGKPVAVEKEQVIELREVERVKDFALGHSIRLSRHDLSEICLGFTIATELVVQGMANVARAKGLLDAGEA